MKCNLSIGSPHCLQATLSIRWNFETVRHYPPHIELNSKSKTRYKKYIYKKVWRRTLLSSADITCTLDPPLPRGVSLLNGPAMLMFFFVRGHRALHRVVGVRAVYTRVEIDRTYVLALLNTVQCGTIDSDQTYRSRLPPGNVRYHGGELALVQY